MTRFRICVFVLAAVVSHARSAAADWLVVPFAGAGGRTETGFLDLDGAVPGAHLSFGAGITFVSDGILGGETEVSWTPSVFTGGDLVESSRVVTATAGLVLALPKRWSPAVRPYFTLGAGVAHVTIRDIAGIFPVDTTRGVATGAAGAWIPISSRVGARASVRYLQGGASNSGNRFKTWQAAGGITVQWR